MFCGTLRASARRPGTRPVPGTRAPASVACRCARYAWVTASNEPARCRLEPSRSWRPRAGSLGAGPAKGDPL